MNGPQDKQIHPTEKVPDGVALEKHEHPQNIATWRKWLIILVVSSSALFTTCVGTLAAFGEDGVSKEFRVERTTSILAVSLFVQGLGLGPLLVGPLSEVFGRNPIYRAAYALLFVFSWPVAFAPNIGTFLAFRFLTGVCGSAFMSVAGGSVSDLFSDAAVASPMAIFTVSPFLGSVVGPLISGFINQHLNWRWTYYLIIIWSFVQFLALLILVPETYAPVLLKKKTQEQERLENMQVEKTDVRAIFQAILNSCYTPFKLLFLDRMALLLDIWSALVLGILYLTLQVYPVIFETGHGFNTQETGLGFLGIGAGLILGLMTQPYWNRSYARTAQNNAGELPPEVLLYMGQVGAICVPVGLFWLAFTTHPWVHWIVPILASVPFGVGVYFVFTATFTYLVVAYRPVAASAMAANSAMRSTFAAVLPLCSGAMYSRLGVVGATALLAGLTTVMAPLPFVLVKIGPRVRSKSPFTV